jgi:hypothetical protein
MAMCPPQWPERRRREVAEMVMAVLRGSIVEWLTSGDLAGIEAGLEALTRALEREEAADG